MRGMMCELCWRDLDEQVAVDYEGKWVHPSCKGEAEKQHLKDAEDTRRDDDSNYFFQQGGNV